MVGQRLNSSQLYLYFICLCCIFTEDMFKYLNVSSNQEMAHILKCLEEDSIQDENVMSEEDVMKLCSGINFGEEIIQDDIPTSAIFPKEDIQLSNITVGDELNVDAIVNNQEGQNILQMIDSNTLVDTPNFDLNVDELLNQPCTLSSQEVKDFDFNLDELLNQPCTLSSQEVKDHMNNFLESDIAKEIEKVSISYMYCINKIKLNIKSS